MRIHVHLHDAQPEHAPPWAVELRDLINLIRVRQETAMSEITEAVATLQTEVAEAVAGMDSAIVLIKGTADLIRENADNAVKMRELAATLDAKVTELATATNVPGTTPAPPAPPA